MASHYNLTYRPGGALNPGTEHSLPEVAKHVIHNSTWVDHHALHMLFGSQFSRIMSRGLPISNDATPFVISDSTAPGDGAQGIAHFLSRHNASYEDVERSMVSMINYAMYGVANVGPQLCDFQPATQFDEMVCQKYMKLAVISPLALYSDRLNSLDNHLFNHTAANINYAQLLV